MRRSMLLDTAKRALSESLQPGDLAVDATVGNGHDTLFLAQQVGRSGHVYGFDIQLTAIERTHQRLCEEGQRDQVTLFQMSHHRWAEALPASAKEQIVAVMFNLGYLPHGDHERITKPETTLPACQMASDWLAPGGRMSIVLYTGHPGGAEEAEQVLEWASSLPAKQFQVHWQQVLNRQQAPSLLLIEKRPR